MALNKNDLITLAKTVANANPSSQVAYSFGEEKFSYSDLNETLRSELKELAGTYQLYRENKNVVFSLIEETINDILPVRVLEQYGHIIWTSCSKRFLPSVIPIIKNIKSPQKLF